MIRVYLRIGKGRNGYKVAAALRPNPAALTETRDGEARPIATLQVRLKLSLSPTAFDAAEIEIPIEDSQTEPLTADVEG